MPLPDMGFHAEFDGVGQTQTVWAHVQRSATKIAPRISPASRLLRTLRCQGTDTDRSGTMTSYYVLQFDGEIKLLISDP